MNPLTSSIFTEYASEGVNMELIPREEEMLGNALTTQLRLIFYLATCIGFECN